ncbi:hypothetical protein FW760_16240 [Pseudomonas sp. 1176_21]
MIAVQPTDLRNQGKFLAETHEKDFDRLTMLIQQGLAGLNRALKRPIGKSYFDAEGRRIASVADPVLPQDAATKNWSEDYLGGLVGGLIGNPNLASGVGYITPTGKLGSVQDMVDVVDPEKGAYYIARATTHLDSLDQLRELRGRYDGDFAETMQYSTARPGVGGARYQWSASSIATANNSTIIQVVGVAMGRWLIQLEGPLRMTQAGAIPDYTGSTGTDNRLAMNEALNAWPHVLVDGHFGITFDTANLGGGLIFNNDNTTLEFAYNGKISALPHNNTIYQMLKLWDRNNCSIIRANLDGRKDLNAAVSGEYGMGIDIRGGYNNRVLDGAVTNNMWGDGAYIGRTLTSPARDVYFERHSATACRRQGCSVASVINLTILNPQWKDIGGTSPGAGIDLEPNGNEDFMMGVRIYNPSTINCAGPGIQVQLGAIGGSQAKIIDIEIHGHVDDGSIVGASVSGANPTLGTIRGTINIFDPSWYNSRRPAFQSVNHGAGTAAINVIRPFVRNPNREGLTSASIGAVFTANRPSGRSTTYPIGNVRIIEPTVIVNGGSVPALFSFTDTVNGTGYAQNCHFIDPVTLSGLTVQGLHTGTGTFSDKYGVWSNPVSGSTTLNGSLTAPLLFPSSAATFTIAAGAFLAGGPDILVSTVSTAQATIQGAAAGYFVGLSAAIIGLRSTTAGSYLRLRPIGGNRFLIVEQVGLWVPF